MVKNRAVKNHEAVINTRYQKYIIGTGVWDTIKSNGILINEQGIDIGGASKRGNQL